MNIAEIFELKSGEIDYTPHQLFRGVYLKHLVSGEITKGCLSSHLVKIEPFCSLETHTHPNQLEIHEVISGTGDGQIAQKKIQYAPGTVEVILPNVPHKVTAGQEGLYILAKFTPALL